MSFVVAFQRCQASGGGKTAQILARAGALVSGAPRDASGQPTNKAIVDWLLMGAEEGTLDMTWEQIEEGADKVRAEGGIQMQDSSITQAQEGGRRKRERGNHGRMVVEGAR